MSKVIRDGKVAVFVSAGYGAGWSTWLTASNVDGQDFMLYGDERMVELVESKHYTEAEKYTRSVVGKNEYLGGIDGLYVEWVDEGTRFYIDEYDGAETLVTIDTIKWNVA